MAKQFPGKIELDNEIVMDEMKEVSSHNHTYHTSYTDISDVPFEEFLHYSLIQRTQEEHAAANLQKGDESASSSSSFRNPFGRWTNTRLPLAEVNSFEASTANMTADQLERANARRALRQAGWA